MLLRWNAYLFVKTTYYRAWTTVGIPTRSMGTSNFIIPLTLFIYKREPNKNKLLNITADMRQSEAVKAFYCLSPSFAANLAVLISPPPFYLQSAIQTYQQSNGLNFAIPGNLNALKLLNVFLNFQEIYL